MNEKSPGVLHGKSKEQSSFTVGVKLIASIIYKDGSHLEEAERELRLIFGPSESLQLTADFDYTDYYYEEFGGPLERKIIVFKELIPIETAPLAKVSTNLLERKMSVGGNRTVNIDPGYITEAKLALFTTKDYSHRLYAGSGIFAECTLFFRDGIFNTWPWTYPDYASGEMREFFGKVRDMYLNELRDRKRNMVK